MAKKRHHDRGVKTPDLEGLDLSEQGPARVSRRGSVTATKGHYDRDRIIESHSVNKHKLLKGYLKEYLNTVGMKGYRKSPMSLYVVDGFCGWGLCVYKGKEHYGSSLQIMDAAHEFLVGLPAGSPLQTDFRFVFVDKDKRKTDFLEDQVTKWLKDRDYPWKRDKITILNNDINAVWESIVGEVRRVMPKSQRAIFFLDQYGYTGLKVPVMWKIMNSLNSPEVICTIATDWLADFHRKPEDVSEGLRKMGVPDSVVGGHIAQLVKARANQLVTPQAGRGLWQQIVVKSITVPDAIPGSLFCNPYCIHGEKSSRGYVLFPNSAIDRSDGFSSLRVTSPGRTLPITDIEVEFG